MSKEQGQSGQVMDQIRKRQTEELSRKILSSMKDSFVGDETRAWLSDVSENLGPGAAAPVDDQPCTLGMVELMDRFFDDFYRYAYQFNQTEDSKRFAVTCHRPKASNKEDASALYQGSLLNSVRAMIVSGGSQSVKFAFIAPEILAVDPTAKPKMFLELTAQGQPGQARWTVDNKPLMMSHLPYLTKKVFARLVRVSRGEVQDTEPFYFDGAQETASTADAGAGEQNYSDVVTYSLISILDATDAEIIEQQQAGMSALKKGGVDALGPSMQRVKMLRAFREKAAQLAQEWSQIISS